METAGSAETYPAAVYNEQAFLEVRRSNGWEG